MDLIPYWYGIDKFPHRRALIEELKNIDHLKLKVEVPLKELQQEALGVEEWVGYQLEKDRPEEERTFYENNWKGRGLIDWTEDSFAAMSQTRTSDGSEGFTRQFLEDGSYKMFVTDLGQKMPRTVDFIYSLCDNPYRCRITSIPPGGALRWHSHCQFTSDRYSPVEYFIFTVQVPLLGCEGSHWGVTPFPRKKLGENARWEQYRPGEAWLFNSWHEHNVNNQGSQDRVSLVLYFPISDDKFEKLVRDSLD